MPFTVEDFSDLTQLLEQRPEWRAKLRQLLLPDEVLFLPPTVQVLAGQVQALTEEMRALAEAQRRTESRLATVEAQIATLAEAQRRTEEQVATLAEAQRRTESRLATVEAQIALLAEAQRRTEEQVAALAEAQRRTEEQITTLTQDVQLLAKRVDSLSQDVGYLKGITLELRYRDRAPAYFRRLARRLRVLPAHELDALLDEAVQAGKLAEAEADEIMEADIVVRGRRREDGAEVYLVAEVSWGVGPHDVERAAERAALLAKAGLLTIPVVAGKVITYEAADLARWKKTWQVLDGQTISPTELPLELASMVH